LELIPRDNIGQDVGAANDEPLLDRQALHAHRLSIVHPITGERMQFEAALPNDIQRTLVALRKWRIDPARQKRN
jgi:23S rRNA pseudouridine1911/1915/1917 synthase